MDRLKLKWRIFGFLLGFCALLIAILWLFQTVLLTEMYKGVRRAELKEAIRLVEDSIDSPDLQAILDELSAEKEIMVMPAQEFAPPVRPNRGSPTRLPMENVTETKAFVLADGQTLTLTFHAMITPVNATVSTLRLQLYIISGILLVCSVILAVIIARRVSRPMEEINDGAKALAAGDYETRFSGHGFLEMKELSDTLNITATELSRAESLRRELMANVSHDLRTPLALIYSYAEMMHDFPAEVTSEQTQTIMDETKRLSSLVDDVLDVSRLETGTMELHPTVYNLTESLHDVIERMAELVRHDGYRIQFAFEDEIYIKADEIKITQAFYNLLVNAVHYSEHDKNIHVSQIVEKGRVRIEVMDHGDGIAPENLPYIWNRYYKVDKTHRRAVTGTGLGLSIVKRIVELHGGTCGVSSEQGKGSVFWFSLPTGSV